MLNRDLWSNPGVKAIIGASCSSSLHLPPPPCTPPPGEHFVFWQQYKESDEAARYMTFYKIQEWP